MEQLKATTALESPSVGTKPERRSHPNHPERQAVADPINDDLVGRLARSHPKLTRGQVWCRSCGYSRRVDSADAMRHGWPKCCGYTMTIDSPEEQVRPSAGTGSHEGEP